MYNSLNEYYTNPLYFTPLNFATIQVPGAPRMTLPNIERVPLGYTVDDEKIVKFKFYYPNAKSVAIHTMHSTTELENENGYWVGKFNFGTGFVMVWLTVDDSFTISQFLPLSYSDNRVMNYIDIPDGTNVRSITDVPHGTITQEFLRNCVTGCMERVSMYLPPMYFEEENRRFPVLFLQHGFSENETSWLYQGKVNFVLDNLISEGKAEPMIVVMCNGMLITADEKESKTGCGLFQEYLINDVIPYISSRYRVAEGRENCAMAGLSMGSIQTSRTALYYPELFHAIGLFSGFLSDPLGGGYNDHLAPENLEKFKTSDSYFFRAIGDEDSYMPVFKNDDEIIRKCGIICDRRIYQGAHEWNVWRQCFVDFVQLIFGKGRKNENQ